MPLESDLKINYAPFDPSHVSSQTHKLNEGLIEAGKKGPKWWEVGASKYRQMRWNGETPFPKPTVLAEAQDITLPSREKGRDIPCRIFHVEDGAPKGIFYHIHGGGWVLQSEHYQDLQLKRYSTEANLIVISVGYRLAPEHPFPKGNEDCEDVAEYLIDHGQKEFGAELKFIGGDSAGAHLSVTTTFHLLSSRPSFAFRGLILNYGAYDLAGLLPQARNFRKGEDTLILDGEIMDKYAEAYLPNTTEAERRDPKISPFYKKLEGLKLPPALFSCGTLDPLLDDSTLMATKWAANGADSILKIYPGAPHGFSFFPVGGTEQTELCLKNIGIFINERL